MSKRTKQHKLGMLQHFPAVRRFQVLHIDIFGPLPPSRGFKYVLGANCRFTRYVELTCLRTMEAEKVAESFFNSIICRHGAVEEIHCDRGTQFRSALFRRLAEVCGIGGVSGSGIRYNTPYNPKGNGRIEVANKTIGRFMKMISDEEGSN